MDQMHFLCHYCKYLNKLIRIILLYHYIPFQIHFLSPKVQMQVLCLKWKGLVVFHSVIFLSSLIGAWINLFFIANDKCILSYFTYIYIFTQFIFSSISVFNVPHCAVEYLTSVSGRGVYVHLPSTLSVLIMALIGSEMGNEWQRVDCEKQIFLISLHLCLQEGLWWNRGVCQLLD